MDNFILVLIVTKTIGWRLKLNNNNEIWNLKYFLLISSFFKVKPNDVVDSVLILISNIEEFLVKYYQNLATKTTRT